MAQLHVLQLLPDAIHRRLDDLDRVLRTDVDEARASLRQLWGPWCFNRPLKGWSPNYGEKSKACSP